MNYGQLICISLVIASAFCSAADRQPILKLIPFNRAVTNKPRYICYNNNDNSFTIAGSPGVQLLQRTQADNITFKVDGGDWKLLKDDKKIVAFSNREMLIVNLNNRYNDITIFMQNPKRMRSVALDSDKNTIFIGYNDYVNDICGIREYCYSSHSYKDFDFKPSETIFHCMVLNLKKDILCLLNFNTISLHKTDDLTSVFKECNVPVNHPSFMKIFGNMLVAYDQKTICIMDGIDDNDSPLASRVLQQYPSGFGYRKSIQAIDLHPSGLLVALVSHGFSAGSSVYYWDIATGKKVHKTILPIITGFDFCFRDDGLEIAIVSHNDCMVTPVSGEIIKQYILLPLWMKLKTIQKECNIQQDVIQYCMNVFTAYCNKKSIQ